ncbi:1-acyl-sn-glycerol-3-phosphate acyltransferase, partial [Roseiflexus sp. AH-315-K22]|nr:1-acyl-sn-glycerol-3-phosphate acyltransferase [Roseiflexus sp. AH-315-K22]
MLVLWIILAIAALVIWACVCRLLLTNPRGDLATGAWVWAMKAYARVMHRLAVRGAENVPKSVQAGPLIVVANHTAGVDPLLMQSACRFEIRWVMAKDMRHPAFEAFWRWSQIVFVDRASGEVNGTREALRHVREGGVLGIFPEGGLERPPRVIRPFHRGIGFIIKKTGARVLPVVIEGTPQVDPAWASLWKRSRS